MKQEQFDETILELSAIKDEWNKKFDALMAFVKSYTPTQDEEIFKRFNNELDLLRNDLKAIGLKYKEKLLSVVEEMSKEANDPIITKLCEQVIDNIDHDYARYQGNREKRLRDINDIIEMYKTYKKP